jgi:hypothetical protein
MQAIPAGGPPLTVSGKLETQPLATVGGLTLIASFQLVPYIYELEVLGSGTIDN